MLKENYRKKITENTGNRSSNVTIPTDLTLSE